MLQEVQQQIRKMKLLFSIQLFSINEQTRFGRTCRDNGHWTLPWTIDWIGAGSIPEADVDDLDEPVESMDADDEAEIEEIAEDATDESRTKLINTGCLTKFIIYWYLNVLYC